MIISFKNINGGGGGGYVLPTATPTRLGGVKIGDGINVDSAGTISVEGGSGIEVVTELPASGTDGQAVLLLEHIPEKIVSFERNDLNISVTAVGLTNTVRVFNFEYYGARQYIDVNADNSVTIFGYTTVNVGDTETITYSNWPSYQISVAETGFTIVLSSNISTENIVNINEQASEVETLYEWSDDSTLVADIYMTTSDKGPWCYRVKYDTIPSGSTILVSKYEYQNKWFHYVYENGELHIYGSDSAETYTATTYTNVPQYTNYDSPVSYDETYIYWTDDEIVFYSDLSWSWRYSYNIEIFYKTGWHKDGVHSINKNAFYKDYTFYDFDYNIIIKNAKYAFNDVGLRLNPNSSYNVPYYVYSKSNSNIGPFFAPTTTGETGYVCVAGNGWAAPTWVAPESLTNGVKFWKGTQAEYDAITTIDSSTLYIIVPE